MKKKRINKKLLPLSLGLSFAMVTPLIVNACSTSISDTYLEKLVSKESGNSFSSNLDLKSGIKNALKSDEGIDKYVSQIVGQSLLNFYEYLGSDSSVSIDKSTYKTTYDDKMDEIDTSYSDLLSGNKSTYKGDFPLVFQQTQLDPHGGTEAFWKKEEQIDWAISQFKDLVFSNLFISLVDNSGNYVYPTKANLLKALNGTNGVKFGFSENALDGTLSSSRKDKGLWKYLAKFQEFIFNQWVKSETPFIVDQVSWKYSNPVGGLKNVYKPDSYGTGSLTSGDASYSFPYFDDSNSNDSVNEVTKFINFVNNANSTKSYISDETSGIRNIPSDLSSETQPLKLVTNRKAYSDLSAQAGIAATYLFANSFGKNATNGVTGTISESDASSTSATSYAQTNLKKTITTTSDTTLGLDPISSNFITSNLSNFKNENATAENGKQGETYVPYTEIPNALASQILQKTPAVKSMENSGTSTSNGSVYSIDAFQAANSGLTDFIFLRTSDGVTAIAIDGAKHIASAKNLDEAKTKAGEVVLYRYLENATDSSSGTPIDLKTSLSTFFTENMNTLLYKFWLQNSSDSSNNLISFDWLTTEEKNLVNAYLNYKYVLDHSKDIENYQSSLYSNKNSYSTNYGNYQAKKNGLAAQFPYDFSSVSSTSSGVVATATSLTDKYVSSNKIAHYKVLDTIMPTSNPFGDTTNTQDSSLLDWSDPYSADGAYSKYMAAVDAFVNAATLAPLTSDFEGFKYSQYILSNNYFVNEAIIAYGDDSDIWSQQIKSDIIVDSINKNQSGMLNKLDNSGLSDKNLTVNSFTISTSNGTTKETSSDLAGDLNSALSNYFFNSTFDGSSSKWLNLSKSNTWTNPSSLENLKEAATTTTTTLPTIKYTDLDAYRRNMWLSGKTTYSSSNISEYYNFVSLIATIQYLLEDNGARFMTELQNKLEQNASTFIVWESSIDKSFDTTSKINNSKELLYGSDGTSVITNVNNSQATAYYTNSTTTNPNVGWNTSNSTFNSASNYYTHVAGMNGFQGIQTSSGDNISTPLKEILFETPWKYNSSKTGLLYGFASSREALKNIINGYVYNNEVDDLADKMQKLFPEITDFKEVKLASSLQEKQKKLIEILDKKTTTSGSESTLEQGSSTGTYVIPDEAFKPRNGYINSVDSKTAETNVSTEEKDILYKDENNVLSKYEYGSYVIQINSDNLKDLSTFISYLKTTFSSQKVDGTATSTEKESGTTTTDKEAWNLLVNLLVSVATTSSIQTQAVNNIATNNKIDVYDIRLNNGLGENWVSNWKDQEDS